MILATPLGVCHAASICAMSCCCAVRRKSRCCCVLLCVVLLVCTCGAWHLSLTIDRLRCRTYVVRCLSLTIDRLRCLSLTIDRLRCGGEVP